MTPAKIMIATPTPGRVATVFMKTVIATMSDLSDAGITSRFETFDAADLPLQRNILATRFYESDCTHLFWVDADMMFHEKLCATLMGCAKPFVGTVYAGKQFDFSRVEAAMAKGLTPAEASTFASDWIAHLIPDRPKIEVENGLLEVDRIAFGAMLITRDVLDIMIKRAGVKRQALTNNNLGSFYNFFTARAESAMANQHVSEDMSFCDRWRRDCGGRIWAYVDTTVYHIGDFAYGGSYMDYLRAVARLQATQLQISETLK